MMRDTYFFNKSVYRSLFGSLVVCVFLCYNVLAQTPARSLIGTRNGQDIRLQTFANNGNEYIRASDLMNYFGDQWDYNPLIGTIKITRNDGTRIGIKLDDQRLLEGATIHHTGDAPYRQDGVVYIPFSMVYPYLFPTVSFQTDNNPQSVAPTPTPQTQSSFIFTLPTPTPVKSIGTPFPTFSMYPTPTPFQLPTFDNQPEIRPVKIVLDPGHSSDNQGATAPNGLHESDITLIICQKIKNVLQNQGEQYQVLLTRSGSTTQELLPEQRITFANNQQADLFLSIHCGGLNSDDISRGSVFFMTNKLDTQINREMQRLTAMYNLTAWNESYVDHVILSRNFADSVNQQLRRLYTITNIIKLDSNPRPGRFHILRGLSMPGILIELGNLNHPTTANYLSSDRHQDDIANYIADAIVNYIFQQQTSYQ